MYVAMKHLKTPPTLSSRSMFNVLLMVNKRKHNHWWTSCGHQNRSP